METLDSALSIIDIILCLVDMGLIIYLFFYRFPPEKKKISKFNRLRVKSNRTFFKKY
jgi:hypothetical protein